MRISDWSSDVCASDLVKDGRVVKGVNFVDLVDAGDPVEQAQVYNAAGADELCFLDITASHENRGILLDVVRRTAERCFMPLTVGGGVRSIEDIRQLRSEEHTSELQSLMRISYAVFCLKKKNKTQTRDTTA